MIDRNIFAKQLYETVIPSNMPFDEQKEKLGALQNVANTLMPSSLFRFRTCSERHFNAFERDELWVSTADCMNDGFDTRVFVNQKEVLEQVNGKIGQFKDATQLFQSIPDLTNYPPQFKQKIEQFLKMDVNEVNKILEEVVRWIQNDTLNALLQILSVCQETIKFCCFSESIHSPAMWGLYSLNESGFALEYNFDTYPYVLSPSAEITRDCTIYPVIYSEQRFQVPAEFVTYLLQYRLISMSLRNLGLYNSNPEFVRWILSTGVCPDNFMVTKFSLHKSKEWERETEWRLFCSSDDKEFQNEKHSYCIKKPVAVYLGRKISPIDEKKLRKLAEEKSIPVYKMAMDDCSPSYDLVVEK